MSQGVIARRYAKALLNLAEKKKDLENTGVYFSKLSETFKNSLELREVLTDNKISSEVKQKIFSEVLTKIKAPELIDKFGRFILYKRRITLIPDIEREFNYFLQEKLGKIEVKVTVPYELPIEDIRELEIAITKFSGKKVTITVDIDPAIIGGIITRIGSIVLDGSVKNQLNQIHKTIIRG